MNSSKKTLDKNYRIIEGTVVSDKMKDTVSVLVTKLVKHSRYGKFVRRRKKYLAHDPGNKCVMGEKVKIHETKPISKRKAFIVVRPV